MTNHRKNVTDRLLAEFSLGGDTIRAFAGRLWAEAFKRGYERGKSDEKDAREIDLSLTEGEQRPAGEGF